MDSDQDSLTPEFERDGYSEESLRMLETDEGQSNAVFACYGSAAQHAQMFEQGLTRFLLIYNEISSESVSINDLEAVEKGLRKRTMGQLIQELLKHIEFPGLDVPCAFERAIQSRNFLMHHFFLERERKLGTAEGRFELLSEIVSIEEDLDRCRIMINAMRIALCRSLGIEDRYLNNSSGKSST